MSSNMEAVGMGDLPAATAPQDTDTIAVSQIVGGGLVSDPLNRMTLLQLADYIIASNAIATLQADVATNTANITALQTALTQAQSDITALQTALTQAQSDITAIKARTQVADSTLTPNPPNTNSTAFITAGIGVQFTPTSSTRAFIIIDGQLGNSSNGQASDFQLLYGQGVAPAFDTLVSNTNGIYIGGVVNMMASRPNDLNPFSASALVTGLVSGDQYWIGAAFRAEGGTATLSQMSVTAIEILDPLS
jgi:hypothetical protein